MKWYWHLLILILSTAAAFLAGLWLDRPLWQIVEPRPVSFDQCKVDRKEWTTLVGDQERKNWWIETRAGRDPTVIRRLKLELPPLTSSYPYFGASISVLKMSCDAVICHEYHLINDAKGNRVEMRYCVPDPTTGKLLRRFTIPNNPVGSIAGHGSKLAYLEAGLVRLFDVAANTDRTVKIGTPTCLTFSPDGKLLACVSRSTNTFYFIDWEKGELIEPIKSDAWVHSFCFITNDALLVTHDRRQQNSKSDTIVHSRWHWDGTELKQVSPGINLKSNQILPFVKYAPSGELHLSADELRDWPLQVKPLLQWLADKKVPVEKWLPKTGYRRWLVLNAHDQIEREYYVSSRNERRDLYDQLSVEMKPEPGYASSVITLWNEQPVWPNALAVGVVFYLMLYVMMSGWRQWRVR